MKYVKIIQKQTVFTHEMGGTISTGYAFNFNFVIFTDRFRALI